MASQNRFFESPTYQNIPKHWSTSDVQRWGDCEMLMMRRLDGAGQRYFTEIAGKKQPDLRGLKSSIKPP